MNKKDLLSVLEGGYIKNVNDIVVFGMIEGNLRVNIVSRDEQIIYDATLKNFNGGIDPFDGSRVKPVDINYVIKSLKTLGDEINISLEYENADPVLLISDEMFSVTCAVMNKHKSTKFASVKDRGIPFVKFAINKDWISTFKKLAVAATDCKYMFLYREGDNVVLDMNQGTEANSSKSVKINIPIPEMDRSIKIKSRKYILSDVKSLIYNLRNIGEGYLKIYDSYLIGLDFSNENLSISTHVIGLQKED